LKKYSTVGKSTPNVYGSIKARGLARYTGDIVLPSMLYGKVLRSPYPHAKILNIDTSKAEKLYGVKAVVTGKTDPPKMNFGIMEWSRDHCLLPCDKVRYYGEEVAAVAAIDEDVAEEAIELIEVEYEELPAIFDPIEAMKEGAPLIHDDKQGNVAAHYIFDEGNVEEGFSQSDLICEDKFSVGVISHACPEPYVTLADYDPTGKFNLWLPTQCPFQTRQGMANILGVKLNDVRIHNVFKGATNGGRSDTMPSLYIAAVLSRRVGKPVKITFTREETQAMGRDRVDQYWTIRIGVKKDGTIMATDMKVVHSSGAYASSSVVALWVPIMEHVAIYRSPNVRYDARTIYTNRTICSMMRTHTEFEPMVMETELDKIAEELGLDPVEIRLKNAVKSGEVLSDKAIVTSCGLSNSIKLAAEKTVWKEKRGKMRPNRGIGMGCGVMVSGFYLGFRSGSTSFIKFDDSGVCTLFSGNVDSGQGNETMHLQIAANELGIPMEDIKLVFADTELCFQDPGNYSMTSTMISGNATRLAAIDARQKLFREAADMFNTSPDQVEFRGKVFYRKRSPIKEGIPIANVCRMAYRKGHPILGYGDYRGRMDPTDWINGKYYGQKGCSYSYGTVVAEVEVDIETGRVDVLDLTEFNDCGYPINPIAVEGQMDGTLIMLLGHTLFERNVWDTKTGRKRTDSFRTYKLPTALDIPNVDKSIIETIDPDGPYGAKEPSLGGGLGATAAIINAIYDAVGVRVKNYPVSSEEILRLLSEKCSNSV